MKKTLAFRIITIILIALTLGGAITFAWYINTRKTNSIEVNSSGISISYRINSDSELNQETFDINNVSFFDVMQSNEAYYLPNMAITIKMNVTNYSTQPVNLSVYQNTQNFRLGTLVENGEITVYRYTKVSISRSDYVKNTHFIYDNDTYLYSSPDAYSSGNDYYTRGLLFVATPTITDDKITAVSLNNSNYVVVIDNDGLGFAVEEYVQITGLTQDQFNLNGAIYYTLENTTYTAAKTYDSTKTYYERRTVAYLSDLTIASSKVTKVDYSVTGAYVECIIADATKLTNTNGVYSLPTVVEEERYTTSVDSYLTANGFSHSYTTEDKLAKGTLNIAGGSKDVYIFVYGVQPYPGATNNFLDNDNNVYPILITIKAE